MASLEPSPSCQDQIRGNDGNACAKYSITSCILSALGHNLEDNKHLALQSRLGESYYSSTTSVPFIPR